MLAMSGQSDATVYWWERPWFLAMLLMLAVMPLLWPTFPPLNDLIGHMGRYRVQLDIGSDPVLQEYYSFEWALLLNLGVDLLIELFGPLFGVEFGTKLIVILTMLLSTSGVMWLAKEIHGRIPPTAMLALPFFYGNVTSFGFINYILSAAIALNLFAFWLWCERRRRLHLRTLVMVPAAFLLAICHIYGWGILGLLVFGYELQRFRKEGFGPLHSCYRAGLYSIVLTGPVLLLIFWRDGSAQNSITIQWFEMKGKFSWIAASLRDRWGFYDRASVIVLGLIVIRGIFSGRIPICDQMKLSLLLLLLAYLVIPFWLMSSAYADMRLAPILFITLCVSLHISPEQSRKFAHWVGIVALTFVGVRLTGNTISYALYDRDFRKELEALTYIPQHARLYSAVNFDCDFGWYSSRKDHFPAMALVRNRAYSNDQWVAEGAQLIRSRIGAPDYEVDGSQSVTDKSCTQYPQYEINRKLKGIPRDKFDYIWLIDVPPYDASSVKGMTLLWSSGSSAVYRIDHGN